jgi:DNA-nicking Smr family endonuclease
LVIDDQGSKLNGLAAWWRRWIARRRQSPPAGSDGPVHPYDRPAPDPVSKKPGVASAPEPDLAAEATHVVPIEDVIDLHPFAPRDIPAVVEAYLEAAAARGFDEVRIIHGRGKGVQRRIVQSLLARHPLVLDFRDAGLARGGWGATVARLRSGQNTEEDDA